MHFSKSTAAASALLMGSAYGHMVMNTPTPYGFSDLQTSPLNGDNYKFPCQSGSRTDAFDANGVSNAVVAGGEQTVKFTGAAVHGGGSCQFSVTYDYPPPADPSKWKVIHTIIGDCPTTAVGNIQVAGADTDGRPTGPTCESGSECLHPWSIPIPKQLKNGNATFAWTWFNNIGNREMYMNCAPISISGGASDDSFLNTLPEMFVANLPGKCTTNEGVLNIPNPGKSVQVLAQPSPNANGNCPAGGSVGSASSAVYSAPAASSAAASSAVASSPVASSQVASYTPSAPAASSAAASVPGVFAPGAGATGASSAAASSAVASSAAASTPAYTPTPTFATVAQSSVAAGTGGAAAPTGGASGDKVACTNEGGVVCMGSEYFGLCDHGFAVKMAVASGTKCENGAVSRRSVPRKHLHARIHGHS